MLRRIIKGLKYIFLLLWLLGLFVIGAWVVSENSMPVSLRLMGLDGGEHSLGIVVFVALLVGWCLGFISLAFTLGSAYLFQRRRLKVANNTLSRLRTEQKLD